MVNISKKKLRTHIERDILSQFTLHVARLRGEKRTQDFLNDLLTDAERMQAAKRLAIIILLMRGYSFTQIQNALKVTPATVVKLWKAFTRGAFKTIREKSIFHGQSFKEDTALEGFLKLMTSGMPPRAGKGRWKFLKGV